jgi:GNAT superfamily N-acetyltransferase
MQALNSKLPSLPPDIVTIRDSQQRDITIRRWGDNGLVQLRAYDNAVGPTPEIPNIGQAGMANLSIETLQDGTRQVRLQDIFVPEDYRNSGVARHLLDQTVDIAKARGATNIYGVIENEEALNYWKHLEEKSTGWKVQSGQGAYGYVGYDLSSAQTTQVQTSIPEIQSEKSPISSNEKLANQANVSSSRGEVVESNLLNNHSEAESDGEDQEIKYDQGYGY